MPSEEDEENLAESLVVEEEVKQELDAFANAQTQEVENLEENSADSIEE